MTHILHLGHQPTDVSGIAGMISTAAAGFDPDLDVNGIRFTGSRSLVAPFAIAFPAPAGDLWLGFRYVPPNGDSDSSRVNENTRVIAVDVPNTNTLFSGWKNYRTSVDAIEAATGYDILSRLSPFLQSVLEARVDNL